jgi:hypothetical protein
MAKPNLGEEYALKHLRNEVDKYQTDWLKDQDPNAKGKLAIAVEELKDYINNLRKRGIDI